MGIKKICQVDDKLLYIHYSSNDSLVVSIASDCQIFRSAFLMGHFCLEGWSQEYTSSNNTLQLPFNVNAVSESMFLKMVFGACASNVRQWHADMEATMRLLPQFF